MRLALSYARGNFQFQSWPLISDHNYGALSQHGISYDLCLLHYTCSDCERKNLCDGPSLCNSYACRWYVFFLMKCDL